MTDHVECRSVIPFSALSSHSVLLAIYHLSIYIITQLFGIYVYTLQCAVLSPTWTSRKNVGRMRVAYGMVMIGTQVKLARLVSGLHAAPVPFNNDVHSAH